ncbi:hypothetical protein GLA29479_417 [Lysobacter antibioticus]|nr:hypothetical protein GLA29479_417 [Lysobacter antibioticus]
MYIKIDAVRMMGTLARVPDRTQLAMICRPGPLPTTTMTACPCVSAAPHPIALPAKSLH